MNQISLLSHDELVERCMFQENEIKTLNRRLQEKQYKIETLRFKLRRAGFKDPSILMKEARRLRNEVSARFGSGEAEFWNAPGTINYLNQSKLEDFDSFKQLFVLSPNINKKVTSKAQEINAKSLVSENPKVSQRRYKSTMPRYSKNSLPKVDRTIKR